MQKNAIYLVLTALLVALTAALWIAPPARADVAPPEPPPGAGIAPGQESTQVRMVSEQVILTVLTTPAEHYASQAQTEATFLMRNLGTVDESMEVRFPLSFGSALYYADLYPEITDFRVQVNGVETFTTRMTTPGTDSNNRAIPWAAFPVAFPAGKDVVIRVSYLSGGFGYQPFMAFKYILETGAGWNGTIGSGDIIVKLPYAATPQNVLINETTGFSISTNALVFDGNDVRWHFDDFEPQPGDNFQISLVMPSYWQKVLLQRQAVSQKPQDGEAWGQLGKAIKQVIRFPKGYLRTDEGGSQLLDEADQAYGKAVMLLPKDALWHYGYADLLWSHYLFDVFYPGRQDYNLLSKLCEQLRLSLSLDPNNADSQALTGAVGSTVPGAIAVVENGYDFLILTATPTLNPETATPTAPTLAIPTHLPLPAASPTPIPIQPSLAAPTPTQAAPTQAAPLFKLSVCGGSVLILLLLAGAGWLFLRKH